MSQTTERFTIKDNLLMTNSLLQMMPTILISAYMMFNTKNDWIWIFSALSFCSSYVVVQMSEASYETDCENYGLYSKTIDMYNTLALSSCLSLLGAIGLYFRGSWLVYPDRMYPSILILGLVVCYFVRFTMRKKRDD